MTYAHTSTVALPYAEAVNRTREALAGQGIGELSDVDVRATFEAKLGSDAGQARPATLRAGREGGWSARRRCCPASLWSLAEDTKTLLVLLCAQFTAKTRRSSSSGILSAMDRDH